MKFINYLKELTTFHIDQSDIDYVLSDLKKWLDRFDRMTDLTKATTKKVDGETVFSDEARFQVEKFLSDIQKLPKIHTTISGIRGKLLVWLRDVEHVGYVVSKTTSSQLNSPLCVDAHKIKPITIYTGFFPFEGAFYNPVGNCIYVGFPVPGLIPLDRKYYDIVKVRSYLVHEMTHWLDDAINNLYLTIIAKKSRETGKSIHGRKGHDRSFVEIRALVQELIQVSKDIGENEWNKLNWESLEELSEYRIKEDTRYFIWKMLKEYGYLPKGLPKPERISFDDLLSGFTPETRKKVLQAIERGEL